DRRHLVLSCPTRRSSDLAERFREQSAQQLGGLLDPLKVQLKEFREAVTQTHANEQRERGMLAQEIQSLRQLNQRISEDAVNLTRDRKSTRLNSSHVKISY